MTRSYVSNKGRSPILMGHAEPRPVKSKERLLLFQVGADPKHVKKMDLLPIKALARHVKLLDG